MIPAAARFAARAAAMLDLGLAGAEPDLRARVEEMLVADGFTVTTEDIVTDDLGEGVEVVTVIALSGDLYAITVDDERQWGAYQVARAADMILEVWECVGTTVEGWRDVVALFLGDGRVVMLRPLGSDETKVLGIEGPTYESREAFAALRRVPFPDGWRRDPEREKAWDFYHPSWRR